jgi:hypothetical protein
MRLEHAVGSTWNKVRRNPQLHAALSSAERLARVPWHSHADRPNSSQVFCVSAFLRLAQLPVRQAILSALFSRAFPDLQDGEWALEPEFTDNTLLGEAGAGQPTRIDMLCVSPTAVVAIESKFDRDARDGFRGCSQYQVGVERPGRCLGFYGPGSDAGTGTHAWCRLEVWHGRRAPRLYWALGRTYFQPEVFKRRAPSDICPFRDSNFQLMRNFLFVAALAARDAREKFAVLVLCPNGRSEAFERQVKRFRDEVLLGTCHERVRLLHYEDYIRLLQDSSDADANELGTFLHHRIAAEIMD